MIAYPSRIVPDLHGLAYVNEGESNQDRRARLADFLGEEVMDAVRLLDNDADAGTAVSRLAVAFLPTGLKAVYDLFVNDNRLTSNDLIRRLELSGSVASSRLTDLEQLGLILLVGMEGRARVYEKVIL